MSKQEEQQRIKDIEAALESTAAISKTLQDELRYLLSKDNTELVLPKKENELEDWMKVRVETWCGVYLLTDGTGITTKEQLNEVFRLASGKDKSIGLGGFFRGSNPSFSWTVDGKIALTQIAESSIKKWTGKPLKEYCENYRTKYEKLKNQLVKK